MNLLFVEVIKEHFTNYFLNYLGLTFDMFNNKMKIHQELAESWKVILIDVGDNTMTGRRMKRIKDYLNENDDFSQSMDTLRDKHYLEGLWKSNKAPWKLWI